MPNCRFCAWVRRIVCPTCEAAMAAFWDAMFAWENAETGYSELYYEEPEAVRAQLQETFDLEPGHPEQAFANRLELAEAGSPTAMYLIARAYDTGSGVSADSWQAMNWYYRAICAGSWTATIDYARLLDKVGEYEACDQVLKDGIDADLATSRYLLARLRYERAPGRKAAREVRPLLDRASKQGHPGAEREISRLMFLGKFGFGQIREGSRRIVALKRRYENELPSETETVVSKELARTVT